MAVTYQEAPEVAEIAGKLINQHHRALKSAEIEYVFRSEATRKGGKEVLGKARKVSGLNAFLSPADGPQLFVMEIARDTWEELEPEQRKALVDHELCHFFVDPETHAYDVLPHDVEEFEAVLKRHGLWAPSVESFSRLAAEQLQLSVVPDVAEG
jgi:hypothetical protein